MSNKLQSVIQLQELDKRIATLQAWIDALPHHLLEIEKQLQDITQAHNAAKERIAANQRQRRQFDVEIQTIDQKISKYNHQLLDVKTNEEYKALLREIDFGKSEIKRIEDKILELMIAVEGDEAALQATGAELRRQQQTIAKEKQEAEEASRKKQEELNKLKTDRQVVEQSIGDSVMELYQRIAKLRDGVAVAEARDQVCTVCHVKLRPQTFNEVMRNQEIIQCSNCSRILYWVPPQEPAAAAPATSGEPARE